SARSHPCRNATPRAVPRWSRWDVHRFWCPVRKWSRTCHGCLERYPSRLELAQHGSLHHPPSIANAYRCDHRFRWHRPHKDSNNLPTTGQYRPGCPAHYLGSRTRLPQSRGSYSHHGCRIRTQRGNVRNRVVTSSPMISAEPAHFPHAIIAPEDLPGWDPRWSRLVDVQTFDGTRRFHVLD